MKNNTKKLLSGAIAATSVFGVAQPAMAAQAEKVTAEESATSLVEWAEATNAMIAYMKAETEVKALPAGAVKTDLTVRLLKVADLVKTEDYMAANDKIQETRETGYIGDYLAAKELIAKVENHHNVTYLTYVFNMDLVNAVYKDGFKEAMEGYQEFVGGNITATEMDKLIQGIKHEKNKKYLDNFFLAELDKVATKVEEAEATHTRTITVTGEGLRNLTTKDVEVEGYTVAAVNFSRLGDTLTIVVDEDLEPGDINVSVDGKELTVDNTLTVDSAEVNDGIYDDDTKNQEMKLTVNGKSYTVAQLNLHGYTIEFNARTTSNVDVTEDVFESVNSGILKEDLTEFTNKELTVSATLHKSGSDIITSTKGTIKIANIDNNENAKISSYDLRIIKDVKDNEKVNEQKSKKLVVGESGVIEGVKFTINGEEAAAPTCTITSDKAGVISVEKDADGVQVLRAVGAGTANITISYGKVSETFAYTVTNEQRVVKSVESKTSSIGLDKNTVEVVVLDQYGDIIEDEELLEQVSVKVANEDIATVNLVNFTYDKDNNDKDGYSMLVELDSKVTDEKSHSTYLSFYDVYDSYIGRNTLKVSNAQAVASKAIVAKNDDTELDLQKSGDSVSLKLSQKNNAGVELDLVTDDLFIEYDKGLLAIDGKSTGRIAYSEAGADANGYFKVSAATTAKAGTATVAIYKETEKDGKTSRTLVAQTKVTIKNGSAILSGVKFKDTKATITAIGTTVNAYSVLDIKDKADGKDPVVNSSAVTVTGASAGYAVRIDKEDIAGTANTLGTAIYLDIVDASGTNGSNGKLDIDDDDDTADDRIIGYMKAEIIDKDNGNLDTQHSEFTDYKLGDILNGFKVESEDKGTILFTITNINGTTFTTEVKIEA